MKKPEKKDIPKDCGDPEYGWAKEVGFNQACDEWEKWLVDYKFRHSIFGVLSPETFAKVANEYGYIKKKRYNALEGVYEGLKASNELNKKELESIRSGGKIAGFVNKNSLPSEEEIAEIIKERFAVLYKPKPWEDLEGGFINNDMPENMLAKAIHKRIRGRR